MESLEDLTKESLIRYKREIMQLYSQLREWPDKDEAMEILRNYAIMLVYSTPYAEPMGKF